MKKIRDLFGNLFLIFASIVGLCVCGSIESHIHFFMPIITFLYEDEYDGLKSEMLMDTISMILPIYEYGLGLECFQISVEDNQTYKEILKEKKFEKNNQELLEKVVNEETSCKIEEEMKQEIYNYERVNVELDRTEEHNPFQREQKFFFDWDALENIETLKKTYYVVSETTSLDSEFLNIEKLKKNLTIKKELEGPQILIYHTHSQEAFVDSIPGDEEMTVQGIGKHLAHILQEVYGYEVLHHTGKYDIETRDQAYSRALPEVEKILKEYPTIQVVIDLHRDAAIPNRNMVVEIDGKPTARIMFFNGISRNKKNGEIKYLHNPNLEDNLAFTFQMHTKAEEYYPGLSRKIFVREYRYNLHVKPRALLIELGDNSNTVEEAKNACEPLAHILDMVIRE